MKHIALIAASVLLASGCAHLPSTAATGQSMSPTAIEQPMSPTATDQPMSVFGAPAAPAELVATPGTFHSPGLLGSVSGPVDLAYMARVEQAARTTGVMVYWINPPRAN
jgi:hypothetical protein